MALLAALVLALLAAPAALAELSVQGLLATSQFSGFQKLLEQAGVVPDIDAALKSGKGVTIFCPSDDALLYHTSPTLLAFLKVEGNRETLRKLLLSHVLVGRVSPFGWEGEHMTLAGSRLPLTMDSRAFYAANVAVQQYNALSAGDVVVHSVPTLIIAPGVAQAVGTDGGAADAVSALMEDSTDARRVLQGAMSPGAGTPGFMSPPPPKAAPAGALLNRLVLALAPLVALLF